VKSHINFSKLMGVPDSKAHDTFETAQQEYLRGNWYEAEAMLLDLLEKYPRDAEAILLLVGVLRHTQRFQPAIRRLDLLESLDTSAPWRFEIAQERKILERLFSQSLVE
jgi:predicted Zn-dependent protease